MLCCVPKRLADGGPFYDEAPFHDWTDNSPPSSVREIRIELFPQEGELAVFCSGIASTIPLFLELLNYSKSDVVCASLSNEFQRIGNEDVLLCTYLVPHQSHEVCFVIRMEMCNVSGAYDLNVN